MDKERKGIPEILKALEAPGGNWLEILRMVLSEFDCTKGTIHFTDKNTGLLKLQAEEGIPSFLIPKLSDIPFGKGMAGIAAERREAVELCNLQIDTSGVARPAAKETEVAGSIAVPMLADEEVAGVFGIAKPLPYNFTKAETTALLELGAAMAVAYRTQV